MVVTVHVHLNIGEHRLRSHALLDGLHSVALQGRNEVEVWLFGTRASLLELADEIVRAVSGSSGDAEGTATPAPAPAQVR